MTMKVYAKVSEADVIDLHPDYQFTFTLLGTRKTQFKWANLIQLNWLQFISPIYLIIM